jgi:hypothetical protein
MGNKFNQQSCKIENWEVVYEIWLFSETLWSQAHKEFSLALVMGHTTDQIMYKNDSI